MSIHRLSRIFYLASGVLLSLLAVFALLLFRGQHELKRTQDIRYASYLLADELRQSSDDLTRMARTYVITGDSTFERMYWETLAIRNGETPRPRHYERIYWDRVVGEPSFRPDLEGVKVSLRTLMERLGFTSAEFAKLAEAEHYSNELVQTELTAFNAMKGLFRDSTGQFTVTGTPDPELARRILHDKQYHQAKAAIMKPVNDFYELLDTRTGDAVRTAEHRANLYLTAVLLLLGLILLLLALSYVIVRKARVAEEALRQSEQRTRLIVEAALDAIVTMDARGLITGWNAQAEKMFGWSSGEAVGQLLADMIIPPQHREAHERGLRKFLETGEGPVLNMRIEITALRCDGGEFPVELTVSPLQLASAWIFSAFIRDIGERKRSETALAERARLAELGAEVGVALTQEENLRVALQRCTEAMVQHLNAAFARIWTLNPEQDVLELQASAGLYTHLDGPHSCVPVGQFKIGLIAQERKPYLTNAVIGDPRVSDQEWATRERMVAFAGYPLLVEDRLVGVMAMFARHSVTDFTLTALASVADEIALGINHKQAAEALRKSEAQFRATFTGAGIGMGVADMEGHILEGNPVFHQMLGYSQAELTGKVFSEFTHPDDVEKDLGLFAELRGGKRERYQLEKRYRHREGHVVWGRLTVSRVQQASGTPQLAVAMIEDITERKRAEEALRESEERFRRSFELGLVGMAITSPTKGWIEVNDQCCKILGYDRSELLHMTWAELTHLDDLAADFAQFNRVLAGECDGYVMDKRFIRKDGQVIHTTISTTCLRRADGTIDSFVALVQDMSERKAAEDALRESEERYRLVSQVISDYAFSIHFEADGTISYDWLTESFTKITGYEVAEILGKPNLLQKYIHREDLERINTTIRRLPPGAITSYEFRIICRDGSVRWLRSYARPVFDDHGQLSHLYGATQDITEHKRDEEEKRKLQEQLFQAQKLEAIGTLAGGIAHDFNNILTIILGFSELLKKAVRADAVAQSNLEQVRTAGNRAKELVQQLLAFSRPEQHTRSPVDLHLVVAETLRLLRAVLPTTIDIRSSLHASGAVVLANATQLHQIIMNLGVNALQAMQDTGGVLEVRLEPTRVTSAFARIHPSLTPGSYCQLTVRDTGCGMMPEVMARIFDPFFTTKPVGQGSGLGLSIIHGIVSSCGGTVTVASTPGQGTTFTVYLPQSPEAVTSPAPVALPSRSTPGRVVLFVDDEKAVAQLAQQTLEHLGYEAVVTTSSHEAHNLFRHRPGHFDVVVTDQTMPGLTGDQLARELLALRPELPIILCTGFSPTLTEEKARVLGIRTYLRKPLSAAELGGALADIFTS